jgi:hypothetical protein
VRLWSAETNVHATVSTTDYTDFSDAARKSAQSGEAILSPHSEPFHFTGAIYSNPCHPCDQWLAFFGTVWNDGIDGKSKILQKLTKTTKGLRLIIDLCFLRFLQ